ncbi:phosphotransferase family protein [Polymorphospora rubra]|uniref:phosphotransferase family protein n=1 Tax=Polymorphospora rubra TaxID=338584 RepID=UPI003409541D
MPRTVNLVLVDPGGRPLGALAPFDAPDPWWQDVADVVAAARDRHRVEVTVLRLLTADRPAPPGGTVTYLAQVDTVPDGLLPVPDTVDLAPHPRRAPWAEPGGPGRTLRWARGRLDRLGRGAYRPVQRRAWNLSAIWRLDPIGTDPIGTARTGTDRTGTDRIGTDRTGTDRGDGAGGYVGDPVWLKQVPDFFAHEAVVLRWLGGAAPRLAPVLLGADGAGRILLGHVPGEDRYGAGPAERDAIAADHHEIQTRAVPDLAALVAAGLPDRRGTALAAWTTGVLAAHGADLTPVAGLLDGLAGRLAEVAGCGIPDTLVHGDLHPGNVRAGGAAGAGGTGGDQRVIIDWGDACAGHPAFDIMRLTEGTGPATAAALTRSWAARWRASMPGCDPVRALDLLRPVAALRMAAVYADFLARIEPAEHPFHTGDVPHYLALAAEAAGLPRKGRGNTID